MTVHEDVMLKYRMLKGHVFRKEELQEIVVADERQRAYVEALNHLARKPRTTQEIAQRLQQRVRAQQRGDSAETPREGQAGG